MILGREETWPELFCQQHSENRLNRTGLGAQNISSKYFYHPFQQKLNIISNNGKLREIWVDRINWIFVPQLNVENESWLGEISGLMRVVGISLRQGTPCWDQVLGKAELSWRHAELGVWVRYPWGLLCRHGSIVSGGSEEGLRPQVQIRVTSTKGSILPSQWLPSKHLRVKGNDCWDTECRHLERERSYYWRKPKEIVTVMEGEVEVREGRGIMEDNRKETEFKIAK